MSFFGRISMLMVISAVLAVASGCSPGDTSQMDEEKEPHFVLGNSRYNEMDWPGAIDAFEQSLEVNPHSAEAHYRLAVLFDTKAPDPAAAIYHYQQYLKLEPNARNSDVINQRIQSCKMQLAADVMAMPDSPAAQKQLDSLVEQNHQLQAEVDKLNGELRGWSAYYASLKAAGIAGAAASVSPNPVSASTPQYGGASPTPDDISPETSQPLPSQPNKPITQSQLATSTQTFRATSAFRSARSHTHIVASGETMAAIARKHGLSIYALEEANPGVNPKKLHVGQPINLPP